MSDCAVNVREPYQGCAYKKVCANGRTLRVEKPMTIPCQA